MLSLLASGLMLSVSAVPTSPPIAPKVELVKSLPLQSPIVIEVFANDFIATDVVVLSNVNYSAVGMIDANDCKLVNVYAQVSFAEHSPPVQVNGSIITGYHNILMRKYKSEKLPSLRLNKTERLYRYKC